MSYNKFHISWNSLLLSAQSIQRIGSKLIENFKCLFTKNSYRQVSRMHECRVIIRLECWIKIPNFCGPSWKYDFESSPKIQVRTIKIRYPKLKAFLQGRRFIDLNRNTCVKRWVRDSGDDFQISFALAEVYGLRALSELILIIFIKRNVMIRVLSQTPWRSLFLHTVWDCSRFLKEFI